MVLVSERGRGGERLPVETFDLDGFAVFDATGKGNWVVSKVALV